MLFLLVRILILSLTFSVVTPFFFGWGSRPEEESGPVQVPEYGECSWYGDATATVGRPPFRMANGQLFSPDRLIAAHRTIPLGSRVSIMNTDNNRTVLVEIADRGPSVYGRIAALSPAAFAAVADLDQKVFPCLVTF